MCKKLIVNIKETFILHRTRRMRILSIFTADIYGLYFMSLNSKVIADSYFFYFVYLFERQREKMSSGEGRGCEREKQTPD